MLDRIHLLAAVTVLGVLEQAYFFLQVIYARRAFGISPPKISGPPEFERIFRAQVNCSEYFPIFLALLWQAGLFFHQGLAAALGLLYLYARYCYFMGYKASSSESTLCAKCSVSDSCAMPDAETTTLQNKEDFRKTRHVKANPSQPELPRGLLNGITVRSPSSYDSAFSPGTIHGFMPVFEGPHLRKAFI
ncbi:leukotriene C4 synthase isoform X1 [Balearica regulorum gibbericeps]|uniref:leukotriene C4 synthase isoform X1 n=1 Tax=Balearica regulorum gibbericeps TaxID=100784 RepID=UPI003F63DDA3